MLDAEHFAVRDEAAGNKVVDVWGTGVALFKSAIAAANACGGLQRTGRQAVQTAAADCPSAADAARRR